MDKKTYTLTGDTPLQFSGERFVEGDKITAEENQVAHLVASGRLVGAPEPEAATEPTEPEAPTVPTEPEAPTEPTEPEAPTVPTEPEAVAKTDTKPAAKSPKSKRKRK